MRAHLAMLAVVVFLSSWFPGSAGAQNMYNGDTMSTSQMRYSANGAYRIRWGCASGYCALLQDYWNGSQWIGRAYIFNDTVSVFHSPRVEMDGGNFVQFDDDNNWYGMSDTIGSNWLNIQDDGNLVVYDGSSTPLWTPACEFPGNSGYQSLFPFNMSNCP